MNAWGIALLWTALQVSLLCAAGAGVYLATRRRSSASAASTLSSVLLVALVLSIAGLTPGPRWWSIDDVWSLAALRAPKETTSAEVVKPRVSAPNEQTPTTTAARANSQEHSEAALAAAWREFVAGFQQANVRDQPSPAWHWPAWLALALLAGVGLGLVRLAIGLLAARRFSVRATPLRDPAALAMLDEIQRELACGRRIQLRVSARLSSPCTLGWLRPLLILPADWHTWTEGELRSVLAHEVAHIARGDFATGLLAQLGVALHFYNPLVWWLAARLRLEQELAADACGVRLAGGRQTYLTTLARLALRQSDLPLAARAFFPARGTLLRRVEMLHNKTTASDRPLSWLGRTGLALLLVLVGGLLAGWRSPGESLALAAPPETPPAASEAAEAPKAIGTLAEPRSPYEGASPRALQANLDKIEKFMRANPNYRMTPEVEKALREIKQELARQSADARQFTDSVARHPERLGIVSREDDPAAGDNEDAAARQARLRSESVQRLKHLGIAFHNYHDVHKHFPSAVVMGPDGKTPHSWRVALLPYLEGRGKELYDRYRLDEPWDSENNSKVMADGADLFSVPVDNPSKHCSYFVLVGPGSGFFPKTKAAGIRTITDGTARTLAVVEARRDIPWTKPEDIEFTADKPLPPLGGYFDGGYNTLFFDGSVHFLPANIPESLLRKIISKAGREPWDYEEIWPNEK